MFFLVFIIFPWKGIFCKEKKSKQTLFFFIILNKSFPPLLSFGSYSSFNLNKAYISQSFTCAYLSSGKQD